MFLLRCEDGYLPASGDGGPDPRSLLWRLRGQALPSAQHVGPRAGFDVSPVIGPARALPFRE